MSEPDETSSSLTAGLPAFTEAPADDSIDPDEGWMRLSARMIAVDAAQTVLALTPAFIALAFFNISLFSGAMIPYWIIAGLGVTGAVADAMRWVFTRYRITENYVEARTGLFVRKYRSVQRDRIRNVDSNAKLRHRLSGLRVVVVGAGQQYASMESALSLDAVTKADAEALRAELLGRRRAAASPETVEEADGPTDDEPTPTEDPDEIEVFATLNPRWLIYNLFNIWVYLLAAGVLWGGHWLLSIFGFDLLDWIAGVVGWSDLNLTLRIVVGAAGLTVIGVIGMGLSFFNEYWKYELARVPGPNGTALRTRRGLFTTREVNRDESRMRGMTLAEPVFWRWLGVTDTNVITTGFDLWSMTSGAYILPRTHRSFAGSIAARILGTDDNPLDAELTAHPVAALRRRVVWAVGLAAASAVGLLLLVRQTSAWAWLPWISLAVLVLGLLGALIAYRSLGHTLTGPYLVVRSGLWSRSTSALERKAVSTIVIRQSLLQQRLGLATVTAATAAGWGGYDAVDVSAADAPELASEAAPGLLGSFLEDVAD